MTSKPAIDSPIGQTRLSANDNSSGRIGAPLFADKWRNAKVARVAFMIGQGWTAQAIADELADGTTANQITAMTSHWGIAIRSDRHTYAPLLVAMAAKHRSKLCAEAKSRGMMMPDLAGKLLATVAADGLFGAVLD